ncbi:MAG TPA: Mur ligase family protein [Candidatus Saccharimonadales bacterium]|nr:Mur ligase family protein [Candidatus Saccharimonadales bacterium]
MKKIAKRIVAAILGYQVRRLCRKNSLKVIGVAGSIGKTSTKLAIASVLSAGLRVRYQEGNYNDLVSVPLVFFGENMPGLFNPFAWLAVFWRNQKQVRKPYPFDVVVVELGSDGPGQIAEFKRYLNLEIAVITAITPEHMQFFESLDDVAKEELRVLSYATLGLINADLCPAEYYSAIDNKLTYGLTAADYNLGNLKLDVQGLSKPEQYSRLAAVAVAKKLGLDENLMAQGLMKIQPAAGRMRQLKGINGSTIIDDSYNASPEAMKLALDFLYSQKAPQKIAILGNMNELGRHSRQAHEEIGGYCDPNQLNLVVTIGHDANRYMAQAAENKGCRVERFDSPYKAGEFVKPLVESGAAILVKGSQNGVFAEESIKSLLPIPSDVNKLVRQSPEWLRIKQKAFDG